MNYTGPLQAIVLITCGHCATQKDLVQEVMSEYGVCPGYGKWKHQT